MAIVVDRQNESISMLGKSGVNVMINGRITYMPATALIQYLNGMSADNAKAVELITTPPAKFDAEGNSQHLGDAFGTISPHQQKRRNK